MFLIRSVGTTLVILLTTICVSSCSLLMPARTDKEGAYTINVVPHPVTKAPKRAISLVVPQLNSNPIFNTTQMAYEQHPHQIKFYAHNHWAATPAQMLQPLIIETLQDTHYFRNVSPSSTVGSYDYILNVQLMELKQVIYPTFGESRITIRAQITNAATNQIIATKEFSDRTMAPCNTPYGGVVAANMVTTKILQQLAEFCLHKIS